MMMFFKITANDKIAAIQQLYNQDKQYLKATISFPVAQIITNPTALCSRLISEHRSCSN